jgi:hypothetical protein
MRTVFVAFMLLRVALAQISVHLELQNTKDMTQQRFGASLAQADLAIAGEAWSQLVRYDDQIVGIRALDNQCAGGYWWTGSQCSMCACVNAPSSVSAINFAPLDYLRPS